MSIHPPSNLLYTRDHLWLRRAGRLDVYIGITSYAQEQLKFISSIRIDSGNRFNRGELFGKMWSGDKEFDLVMPVTGKMLLLNPEIIAERPLMLNMDPYEFWIALVSIKEGDHTELLAAETYHAFINQPSKSSI